MKKRLKKKANQSSNHNQNSANQKFNKKKININQELSISDKRLETYGLKPNQYKRKAHWWRGWHCGSLRLRKITIT